MTDPIIKILQKYAEKIPAELSQSMKDKGLMASGKTERGITGHVSNVEGTYRLSIMAGIALMALQKGRKLSGKKGTGGPSLRQQIRTWIDDKNITPHDPDITKDQLSYMIANKIHKHGITVPNKFNPGGVISDVITDDLINTMMDEIVEATKEKIFTVIHSAILISKNTLAA